MVSEKWKKRWARWFKLRFAILYPFGIWAVISACSTDDSIMRSIWFVISGLLVRSWANCYAIKMEKLTTSGPYAHVRHPLYLGSFLIMVGFLIMLNIHWLISLICILAIIGIVYMLTVKKEEAMLFDKFGQDYKEYRQKVPAFLPRISPFRGGHKWGPSIERYFRSQEYKLAIWMIILMIAFYLKDEFLVEQESVDVKIYVLIVAAFLLGMLDFIGEFLRKKIKHSV